MSYRRFVILSSPRCGTHMLRSALAEHPAIVAYTEVFNPDWIADAPFGEDTPEDTILRDHVFCDYPSGVQAVGFPLHRAGARFGRWPRLWQRLERDRDIRIISLSRRHLLGRYLSYRHMRERNRDRTLVITPAELKAELRIQETLVSAFDERFARHPLLPVEYEELVDDWDTHIRRVQEFLGVDPLPLKPATTANPPRPFREVIRNYDRLAKRFDGTRWSWMFRPKRARG